MMRLDHIAGAGLLVLIAPLASAAVYDVGSGYSFTSLSSVLPSLQAGDTVNVHPGTYDEIDTISCSGTVSQPITIRGVGVSRPVFDAMGLNPSGVGSVPRGVFEIRGDNLVIQNLEFRNADNGSNGAGIRIREDLVNNCTISNIKSTYNNMGIQGGVRAGGRLVVAGSEVAFNGTSSYNGFSHNFYLTGAGSATVEGNYIHDALYGQNFKSRMHYNELLYNWIADSNEGEVGIVEDSNYTKVANSNSLMVGNTIISKADRTGNHMKYVNFGGDGTSPDHNGTLYAYNNTIIARDNRINYLWVSPTSAANSLIVAANNVFYDPTGTPAIVNASSPVGTISGANNWWLTGSATTPGVFSGTLTGTDPGFADFPGGNYVPLAGSPLVDAAMNGLTYVDGDGVTRSLTVNYQYMFGEGMVLRPADGSLDIGAYEVPEPSVLSLMLALGGLKVMGRRVRRYA